jgi:hypothetical protein
VLRLMQSANSLQGSKEAEAKKLINGSGLKIFAYDGLDEGEGVT